MKQLNRKVRAAGAGVVATLAMFGVAMPTAVAGTNSFSGGDGTSKHPYRISTVTDLEVLQQAVDAGQTFQGDYFVLTHNLQMNGPWSPIGAGNTFDGVFDGHGHTISGLQIQSSTDLTGFFARLGSDSQIENLNLNVSSLTSSDTSESGFFGPLTGYEDGGTINNVHVAGDVLEAPIPFKGLSGPHSYLGGLVGYNGGTILNSSSDLGLNTETYPFWWVGGITAQNFGTIQDSYSTGNISSVGLRVGGLVGSNWGSVTDSYSSARINYGGADYAGGLVGANHQTISNTYAVGTVSVTYQPNTAGGALVSLNYPGATISNSFYDTSKTNLAGVRWGSADGVTGVSDAAMKDPQTFTNAGWDLHRGLDFRHTWGMTLHYPFLTSNPQWQLVSSTAHFSPFN